MDSTHDSQMDRGTEELGWVPVREVPPVFASAVERAEAATMRWHRQGNPTSIEEAVVTWEWVYTHSTFDHASLVFRLDVLNRLGVSYMYRGTQLKSKGDFKRAEERFQSALALAPDDWPQESNYIHNLGLLHQFRYRDSGEMQHLDKSVDFFRLALQKITPEHANAGRYHSNLATSLDARYERQGTLEDLEDAISNGEKTLESSPADSLLPMSLNTLGCFYRQRYLRTDSPEDINRSVELHQLAVDKTMYEISLPGRLGNLGNALLEYYGLSRNVEDLKAAINAQERAVEGTPPGDPSLPIRLNNLGNCLSARYHNRHRPTDLNRTIEAYQQAVQLTVPTDPDLPSRLYNLANSLRSRFEYGNDKRDGEQAVQYYRKACEVGFSYSLEWSLGASKAWGLWAEVRKAWEEANEAFSFGLRAIDRLYRAQVLAESKATWLKEARELAGHAAYVQARLGELTEALTTLERNRTRALSEALTYQEATLREVSNGDRKALMLAHQRIRELESEARAIGQPGARDFVALSADLHQSQEQLGAVVERIRNYLPDFMSEGLDLPQMVSLAESLDRPIVYLMTTFHGSLALIISPSPNISVSSLPAVESLWLDDFRNSTLDHILYDQDKTPRYLHGTVLGETEVLQAVLDDIWPLIRNHLMQPIATHLQKLGYQQAVLVPVGTLPLLPLHAVLLDQVTFAYSPCVHSLQSVFYDQNHRDISPSFLGIGNPTSYQQQPLDFARLEVEEISALFTSLGLNRTTLYEEEARREDIIQKLPGITHLHVACHGQFHETNPLQSTLFLAREDTLTLRDLLDDALDISAVRLVVLSACQTGITEFRETPDEAVGFPAGFIQAGVPGVVSTLWPVNDVSTALLLNRFYHYHLVDRLDPAIALQRSQAWLRDATAADLNLVKYYEQLYRESGQRNVKALEYMRYYKANPNLKPFNHTYFWAGFVFSGV